MTSWFFVIFGGLASVAFIIYYIWVEYRPAIMAAFINLILELIRNALRNNKAFMRWLYSDSRSISEEISSEYSERTARIHNSWREGDFR